MERGSTAERLEKIEMFRHFYEQPDLISIGGQDYETMKSYYNGSEWVWEFEATI